MFFKLNNLSEDHLINVDVNGRIIK